MTAVSGSTHGYDVTHANEIDPSLGGIDGLRQLARDLHARGLSVTLNVHPADGVRRHEDAYPAMATAVGGTRADAALIEAAIARFPVVETVMMRRNVYKEMDEKGLLHAVALQKQADPNPLMRPHVRHVVEALEEATDILNNILAA